MNATITLREYLEKGKTFVVPYYQRGYVWGKNRPNNEKNAVEYMLDNSLIPGFKTNSQIFVQGITVTENESNIILIDGQQRTTFFYLLLKSLEYKGIFSINYEVRNESQVFLSLDNLINSIEEKTDEEFQDIYFFKKTLRIIREKIREIKKEYFLYYLLDNVKFLYIDIPEDKATKVFSMMNGSKAIMKDEELIKAELLRLASLTDSSFENKTDNEKNAIEWDNNILRSRYAREWDKWLQWWNREDVKKLYKHSNVMGYLIQTFLHATFLHANPNEINEKELTFSTFKNTCLLNQQPIDAKKTFDGLRRMQKRFEDAFNDPIQFNKIGAILRIVESRQKELFINWYFSGEKKTEDDLGKYYKWSFIGLTHKEIIEENQDAAFDKKFDQKYSILAGDNLYVDNKEDAFNLLLRLNIDEDNLQNEGKGRKFDFSIWDKDSRGRSLEHIYPKSKIYHSEIIEGKTIYKNGNDEELKQEPSEQDGYIDRDSCIFTTETGKEVKASEHSIGNLVLLYKDDNAAFNDSSFEEKKSMFFKRVKNQNDSKTKAIFKSRHLLHTIYKFSNSSWNGKDIAENKYKTLEGFKNYYGKQN